MGSDGERGFNMDGPSLQPLVRHYGGQAGWTGWGLGPFDGFDGFDKLTAGRLRAGGECVAICVGLKYTPAKIATRLPSGGSMGKGYQFPEMS